MMFNGHRSNVNVKPKACELAQHFHGSHECDIKKDLNVYILKDNVIGSREKKEFYENLWITRLNTKSPNGMITNLKHFSETYYELLD